MKALILAGGLGRTFLKTRLAECAEFFVPPEASANADPSWFGFPLTLKQNAPCSRDDLLKYLDPHKIGPRLLFDGDPI